MFPFGFLRDVRLNILLQCYTGGQIHPQDFYLLEVKIINAKLIHVFTTCNSHSAFRSRCH